MSSLKQKHSAGRSVLVSPKTPFSRGKKEQGKTQQAKETVAVAPKSVGFVTIDTVEQFLLPENIFETALWPRGVPENPRVRCKEIRQQRPLRNRKVVARLHSRMSKRVDRELDRWVDRLNRTLSSTHNNKKVTLNAMLSQDKKNTQPSRDNQQQTWPPHAHTPTTVVASCYVKPPHLRQRN